MPSVRVPPEGIAVCASCRKVRGNTRRGWVPIIRGAEVIGYTCPECPKASEPIRRLHTKTGVRFRAVVDTTPCGSPRRQQTTHTLPTLHEARAFVAEVRAQVERAGEYVPPKPETVAALCDRWLASRRDVRPVTVEGYRNVLAPVLRHFGSASVPDVTVAEVERLTQWLGSEGGKHGKALAPRSVRAALVALAQAFDMAAREGTVTRNVVRLARRPRFRKRVGRDLEHWQPAELVAFRKHADTDALAGAWRLTLCGLTRADVLGLRWSDVDLAEGVVSVS